MQQSLSVRFGYQTESTINFVGASLTAGNIVITLNTGESVVLSSMTAVGTDSGVGGKPRAGYADSGQLTGLDSFTQYTWTAVQGSSSITGTFYTAPSDTEDFCLYFGTCEENNGSFGSGMWPHIRDYVASGALPCLGLIHVDDHGYWDGSDVAAGSAYTFTQASPGKILEYDFALGGFAGLGLYDGDGYADYGQDEDRLWGIRNLSLYPQWGDHDTGTNEMGWSTDPAVAGLTRFTNSTAVWAALMTPLQPPEISGATANGDNSWLGNLGCLELVAPDGISKGSGDGEWPTISAPTTIYGSTQINNILTAVDSASQPFKLMLMQYGIKYMDTPPSPNASIKQLANNPLKDWRLNEFAQLFTETGNSPQSLMDNPKTNGLFGHLVTLHGDAHIASSVLHQDVAYTGNAAESWCSITACALNKGGETPTANIVDGWEYDGSIVKYTDKDASADFYAVRIEVYGSKRNKEIHFVFLESHSGIETIAWTEKLIQTRGGNEPHNIDLNLDMNTSISVGGEI